MPIAHQQVWMTARDRTGVLMFVVPMIFPARVFFPADSVPAQMQDLSKSNPATYGADAIRHLFLGSGPAGAGLGVSVFGHDDLGRGGRARWSPRRRLRQCRCLALRPPNLTAQD